PARKTSRPFCVRIHQRTTRRSDYMNRIRKAGKQERAGIHESRRLKRFLHFLVCLIPDFLIFSCVSVFLIASSAAADVVIGSKKFTESYVLGEIAKRTLTDAGRCAINRVAESRHGV